MITQYRLKVKAEDGQKLHFHWGYTLYGILAQYANTEYIEKIHQQKYTPVSQYLEVLPTGTEAYWYINLFGEQATKEIGMVLEQHHSFHAEHHHTVLQVIDAPEEKQVSELDFCRKYLVEQPTKRQIKVQCITPMGFKSQGNYQIFPTEALFLQSLWRGWQQYAKEVLLDGEDVQKQLTEHLHITDYRLRSTRYALKGNRIPAFTGTVTFSIGGPEALVKLINLLFAFGEYHGAGIKTALGMGGYRILN